MIWYFISGIYVVFLCLTIRHVTKHTSRRCANIFSELLYKRVKEIPMIISYRPPCEYDTYLEGTIWKDQQFNKKYVVTKVVTTWTEISDDR